MHAFVYWGMWVGMHLKRSHIFICRYGYMLVWIHSVYCLHLCCSWKRLIRSPSGGSSKCYNPNCCRANWAVKLSFEGFIINRFSQNKPLILISVNLVGLFSSSFTDIMQTGTKCKNRHKSIHRKSVIHSFDGVSAYSCENKSLLFRIPFL